MHDNPEKNEPNSSGKTRKLVNILDRNEKNLFNHRKQRNYK